MPAEQAVGRVGAELITPYPLGLPAAVPEERLTDTVVEYLRRGVGARMTLPDAADTSPSTIRVVAQ